MNVSTNKRILVVGHRGMVGSAILRRLSVLGYSNVTTLPEEGIDLRRQQAVEEFFSTQRVDEVYLAAARVGGIFANNSRPAEFIYDNVMIAANVIHAAHSANIDRLLFLGSSCIYPRLAEQPMNEASLLTGQLEPTNEPYAIAKIAGIKLCESFNRQYGRDYRCAMPTNLYGPNDNFHPEHSHVVPALIMRFHMAKLRKDEDVVVWGTGQAKREFMHVDDMASACVFLMNLSRERYRAATCEMLSHINVGTGVDCSIRELAATIADIVGFHGKVRFDTSKPDGSPRKLLDTAKLSDLGWRSTIGLRSGMENTYRWLLENEDRVRNSFQANNP